MPNGKRRTTTDQHKTRRTGRGGRWVTLSIILNSEGNVKSAPSMARMDMNMSSKNSSPRRLFTQYLNISFLGERQFIQVGPVNYTFFQFGPLGSRVTGTYHMLTTLSITGQFHEVLLAYRPQHPGSFLFLT